MKQKERLVFCTYPSFFSSLVLQKLLACPDIEVVAIVSSTRNLRIREHSLASVFERIKNSGLHYSTYLWLITSGHSSLSKLSRVQSTDALATKNNILNFKTNNINSDEMKRHISELCPDILLCAHFNQLITPEIYTLATKSAMNIHPSLLPDLQGVDPGFYALLDNYRNTGVSLHHLDAKFDSGDIILNQSYEIKNTDTLFSLNCELFLTGADLFLTYLTNNRKSKIKEKSAVERYVSWPCLAEVSTFRRSRKLLSLEDIKSVFSKPDH